MDISSWSVVPRDYAREDYSAKKIACPLDHPFASRRQQQTSSSNDEQKTGDSSSTSQDLMDDPLSNPLMDPLSGGGRQRVDVDPLSMMMNQPPAPPQAAASKQKSAAAEDTTQTDLSSGTEEWDMAKKNIIRDFAVSGQMKISSTINNDVIYEDLKDPLQSKTVTDRSQARLQALEGNKQNESNMTMTEYSQRIETLQSSLKTHWSRDEKVASLKIAIKAAKLLGDASLPRQAYPVAFVLLTDILDYFGELVFKRILGKAEDGAKKMGKKLTNDLTQIVDEAKETCRNWFFKTACIRELLPRLYIEMALIKCYKFLFSTTEEFDRLLGRMASLIRGIADPMTALYARAYLVRQGYAVNVNDKSYAVTMAYDYIFSFKDSIDKHHVRAGLSPAVYLDLHRPALSFVLKAASQKAGQEVFQTLLQRYVEQCGNAVVLACLLNAFPASHYSDKATAMLTLIKQAKDAETGMLPMLEHFGEQLVSTAPPEDQRLSLLNDSWKIVTKFMQAQASHNQPADRTHPLYQYVSCTVVWLDLLMAHYSSREVLVLLKDLSRQVEPLRLEAKSSVSTSASYATLIELTAPKLEHCVSSLITYAHSHPSHEHILTSDLLLKLLDLFKPSRRVELSKDVLDAFAKRADEEGDGTTNDPILINTLFDLSRTLHDSLDSLSPEGERRHISMLICGFIGKIDYKRDLESQLNMYVDFRAAFPNLDTVKDRLILAVSALAMKALKFMKGKHTKKTAAFVKACLAYCHVTIPSIDDVFRRLDLMLHCAEVALLNQCLPQTDTFLKAAISLIPDIPATEEVDHKRVSTEKRLVAYLRNFLGFLVVVPGHPSHGPAYLVQGLVKAMPRYPWSAVSGGQITVFIDMLGLLSAYEQKKLPYTIDRVESNDVLYGGAKDYVDELHDLRNTVMQGMIEELTKLKEKGADRAAQCKVAELVLDLVNRLVCDLVVDATVAKFMAKLLDLSKKNKANLSQASRKYFDNTVQYIRVVALRAQEHGDSNAAALYDLAKALAE